jgi:hypothetical protein
MRVDEAQQFRQVKRDKDVALVDWLVYLTPLRVACSSSIGTEVQLLF